MARRAARWPNSLHHPALNQQDMENRRTVELFMVGGYNEATASRVGRAITTVWLHLSADYSSARTLMEMEKE
jgi:hypothetical protein